MLSYEQLEKGEFVLKRLLAIVALVVLCLSLPVAAYAMDEGGGPINDGFVDVWVESNERGARPPTQQWDWVAGTYRGSFSFTASIYSNYYFTNASSLNVNVSSQASETAGLPDFYYVDCFRKDLVGATRVGREQAPRVGYGYFTFSGLTSSKSYYVGCTKANDSARLTGTIDIAR